LKPFKEAEVYSAVEIALYLHGTELELRQRAEHLDGLLEEKSSQLRYKRGMVFADCGKHEIGVLFHIFFPVKPPADVAHLPRFEAVAYSGKRAARILNLVDNSAVSRAHLVRLV
jgi:hypothetical protein